MGDHAPTYPASVSAKELPLFTWCAFDTVLFPPLLQVEANVQSICEATDQPITFAATPEGIADLLPATSVLSLILPTERCDCVRGTFCEQSLFFQSEEAASSWMALHPDAVLLSVEEATVLGQLVAKCGHTSPLPKAAAVGKRNCRFSVREEE
jgi:alkylmercury lyase